MQRTIVMNWREIKRDKQGLVTKNTIERMQVMLPLVVLWRCRDNDKDCLYLDKDNFEGWVKVSSDNISYTHYYPVPDLKKEIA